jgi:hypothetical protein
MHKSRLCAFVIDSSTGASAAADFWSRALGRPVKPTEDPADTYRELTTDADEPMVLIQQLAEPAAIHLDIETDNLDAEVARLEALGARRVAFRKRWWVMEAPTGQRFCVVNPQRGPLGDDANEWPS